MIINQILTHPTINNIILVILYFKKRHTIDRMDCNNAFSLGFILSYLDINIPEKAEPITNFSFGIFLLSLISLLCLINIIAYFTVYVLILQGNYESKFPRVSAKERTKGEKNIIIRPKGIEPL